MSGNALNAIDRYIFSNLISLLRWIVPYIVRLIALIKATVYHKHCSSVQKQKVNAADADMFIG